MTDVIQERKDARRAGVLYLLMGVIAPIGLLYVPGKLIVAGDAAATADRLRASEWVLRLGIGSELFHQIVGIFLLLVLYRLFESVDEHLARLLMILGILLSLPIVFVNVLNEIAALILVGGAKFLSAFDRPQRDALAYLFLRLHGQGIQVAAIFWGLWLFPFGVLVIRSRFIPRTLGVLLIVAGCAYLASSFTSLLLPRYANAVNPVAGILEIGELPIVFWLLIWGAKAQPARVPALVPGT
jgi:hypothetical protein